MGVEQELQSLADLHRRALITDAIYEERQRAVLAGAQDPAIVTGGAAKSPVEGVASAPASSNGLFDPKKNAVALTRLMVGFGIILAIAAAYYTFGGAKEKAAVAQVATATGVGAVFVPWTERAATAADGVVKANEQNIANVIQGVAHPTGKSPRLDGYNITKLDGSIQVELNVAWTGLLNRPERTQVVWEIGERGHISARITADSTVLGASARNRELLDDYFRTKVYPAFFQAMRG